MPEYARQIQAVIDEMRKNGVNYYIANQEKAYTVKALIEQNLEDVFGSGTSGYKRFAAASDFMPHKQRPVAWSFISKEARYTPPEDPNMRFNRALGLLEAVVRVLSEKSS